MDFLLIYLTAMNILGFSFMFIDKTKAKLKAYRIPEKRLFAIALLGGGIGCCVGMKWFRHKTKHFKFVWGMPLITIVEYSIVLCLIFGR